MMKYWQIPLEQGTLLQQSAAPEQV